MPNCMSFRRYAFFFLLLDVSYCSRMLSEMQASPYFKSVEIFHWLSRQSDKGANICTLVSKNFKRCSKLLYFIALGTFGTVSDILN